MRLGVPCQTLCAQTVHPQPGQWGHTSLSLSLSDVESEKGDIQNRVLWSLPKAGGSGRQERKGRVVGGHRDVLARTRGKLRYAAA